MSIGLIEGVAEAANSLLKIGAGRLADRTGAPKRIVLAGYALSSAVRPLLAIVSSWTHVLGLRLVDRLGKGIRGAPRDAMLAHFTPSEIRGRVYGFHRAMDHAGAVAGPLIASLFLFFYPGEYRPLFALTIVPGIIVILILLRVPDTRTNVEPLEPSEPAEPLEPRESLEPREPGKPREPGEPREPLERVEPLERLRPNFYRAIAVVFLFSLGNASDAFLLLRLSDLGVATVWIPLLWSALHVVKVVTSVIAGDMSDRWGRRALIASGWIVYVLVYAGFALAETPAPAIAMFLFYGFYFGLTEGVEKAWIVDLAPRAVRGTAFGIYNAALGVGGLAASLIFGFIWTRVSPAAAFHTGAALALAATVLLYLLFSSRGNHANSGH
jgi:MFS family permease